MTEASGLHTLEVRWFLEGRPPKTVRQAFVQARSEGLAAATAEDDRQDVYMAIAGASDLGIKLRGAAESDPGGQRFEVKGRHASYGPMGFGGATGRVERWIKWSHPAHALESMVASFRVQTNALQTIQKTRLRRMMRWSTSSAASSLSLGWELSRLQLGTEQFWSVAFEAVLDPRCDDEGWQWAVQPFRRAVEPLVSVLPVALCVDDCMGYPAWLARRSSECS